MAAGSFLDRKPAPQMPAVYACRACSDSGLIPIAGIAQSNNYDYEGLFTSNIPCVCSGGDLYRREFEMRANPPKCRCGRMAAHCLLVVPICEGCWPEMFAEFRETRDAGLILRKWKAPEDVKRTDDLSRQLMREGV